MIFALIALCATGGAMAQEEAQPVQAAQTQEAAPSGDNRPATLGDIRTLRAETQTLGRELRAETQTLVRELRAEMTNMGQDLRAQIQATHHTLHMALLTIICILGTGIIALTGLIWHSRPGTPSTPDLAFLIPLLCSAALTIKTAIAAVA